MGVRAVYRAMKKQCLAMPKIASQCRTKLQKSPQ